MKYFAFGVAVALALLVVAFAAEPASSGHMNTALPWKTFAEMKASPGVAIGEMRCQLEKSVLTFPIMMYPHEEDGSSFTFGEGNQHFLLIRMQDNMPPHYWTGAKVADTDMIPADKQADIGDVNGFNVCSFF